MARKQKKEFLRKPTGGQFIYGWTPETEITKKRKQETKVKLVGCDAIAGSQGIDNDVTFVYDTINTNSVLSRIAYVACDYVE